MSNSNSPTLSSNFKVEQDTYEKATKTQENTTHKRAKRPALSKQMTTRHKIQTSLHNTDKHETHFTKMIHKRSNNLEQSAKIHLNMFNAFINIYLISDVD